MKKKLLLILLLIPLLFGCAGKHPADQVAKVIIPGTEAYIFVQERLIDARKLGLFTDEQWNAIDTVSDEADTHAKNGLEAWHGLSELNTPEKASEVAAELRKLIEFVKSLMSYLPNANDRTQALNLINSDLEKIKELEK